MYIFTSLWVVWFCCFIMPQTNKKSVWENSEVTILFKQAGNLLHFISILKKPYNCLGKQLLKGFKAVPKSGQAVNFPAPLIHLCYSAYQEPALTEPELFKHFPANIPFPHLTLMADPTCSANKHRSQFSKETFTPNIIIYHVDIWLRFEHAGCWERSRMDFVQ